MVNAKFLKITCPRCKNKEIVYGKSSVKVKCKQCGYLLLRTSGGKATMRARIREILC